jgi:hypothetical protein
MSQMTDNLDPESREKMLKGLSAKGIKANVVVVSELVSEAEETAEDITSNMMNMLMSSGTKKKQGYLKDTAIKSEVEGLLKSCESIHNIYLDYKDVYVNRGHEALYGVLSDIYGLGRKIEGSPHQDFVLEQMRNFLKEKLGIKLSSKSSPMSILVRFVMRADKLEASRYGKVLTVALASNVSPEGFINFVKEKGGVSGLYQTTSEAAEREKYSQTAYARVEYVRKMHHLMSYQPMAVLEYEGPVVQHRQDKESAINASSFCYFVAAHDHGQKFNIISAHDFDGDFEDQILKQIAKNLPSEIDVIEASIRAYMKILAKDEKISQSIRDSLKDSLTKPLFEVQQKKSKKSPGKKEDVVDVESKSETSS